MVMFRSGLALSAALLVAGTTAALAVGERGTAEIKSRDGKDLGQISMIETTSGILLKVKLKGLTPGPHGLHIHETRKCEGDLATAGNIYNPLGAKHGFLNDEGPMAGDLPNLIANAAGEVDLEMLSPFVTLNKDAEESIFDSDGAAFILFEKADDYTSAPEGNAGARIACGPIMPAK